MLGALLRRGFFCQGRYHSGFATLQGLLLYWCCEGPMAVTRVWRGRRDGRRLHGYNDAQICLQGHVINMFAQTDPGRNEEHCSRCGSSTILACPHCKELIRGYFHDAYSGVKEPVPTVPRSFCHKCGKPYLWMEDRLQIARELLYHDDKLLLEDRERLWVYCST